MHTKPYIFVSGTLFGLVAVLQAFRLLNQLPAHVGTFSVPLWASGVAAVITATLCVWAILLLCPCRR
jgi:hypothetical protein